MGAATRTAWSQRYLTAEAGKRLASSLEWPFWNTSWRHRRGVLAAIGMVWCTPLTPRWPAAWHRSLQIRARAGPTIGMACVTYLASPPARKIPATTRRHDSGNGNERTLEELQMVAYVAIAASRRPAAAGVRQRAVRVLEAAQRPPPSV